MRAFSMIELIFVIVIIGILASIAAPKLSATRDDAKITKYRADIAAIRSSIITERSKRLLEGNNSFPELQPAGGSKLFSNVLTYGIDSSDTSGWTFDNGTSADPLYNYNLNIGSKKVYFQYNRSNGMFYCDGLTGNTGDLLTLCHTLTR